MFYFISLMIVWLLSEKALALITVCHMNNVPPLSPLVMQNPGTGPQKKLPPITLSEWEKFELIRHSLKQGLNDFGISDRTGNIAQLLFQASSACKLLAILLTTLLVIKQLLL